MNNHDKLYTPFTIILFLCSLLAYIIPSISEPIMLDRQLIISPLENINSLNAYIDKFKDGKIYDFQPIRDFSHYIDIKLNQLLEINIIPLIHNLLLLFFCTYILFIIFLRFFNEKLAFILALIFLVHPLTFNIFVSYTSRKHILSFLFMLLSFHFFYKTFLDKTKDLTLSIFFYTLSVLSQPINALILISYLYVLYFENKDPIKKLSLKLLPYVTAFIIVISLNFIFYSMYHTQRTGVVLGSTPFQLDHILLSIAIHYKSFFLPYSYAPFYDIKNLSNFIVLLFVPLLYLFTYKLNKKIFFLSASISLGCFITLYGHKSNILNVGFQTYYALPNMLAFLFILGVLLRKASRTIFYIILILLVLISNLYGFNRDNRYNYYKFASQFENECRILQSVTILALARGDKEPALKFGNRWLSQKCLIIGKDISFRHIYINAMLLFISPDFSHQEKRKMLKTKFSRAEDYHLLLAGLEFEKNGPTDLFYSHIIEYKKYLNSSLATHFIKTYFAKNIYNHCKKVKNKACHYYVMYYEKFIDKKTILRWEKNIPHYESGAYKD